MNKQLWRFVIILTAIFYLYSVGIAAADSNVEAGKKIYVKIKKKYPDVFIEPGFHNTAFQPFVEIDLPEKEWDILTKDDKISLCLYAKSLVPILRLSPQKYFPFTDMGDTPIVRQMIQKVTKTCDDCWGIFVGGISKHFKKGKRDILLDRTVVVGEPVYEMFKKENSAHSTVPFSQFRK